MFSSKETVSTDEQKGEVKMQIYRTFSSDNFSVGTIYTSYNTHVAADLTTGDRIRRKRTFSVTTSKHLNRFCPKSVYREVDEEEWYRLVGSIVFRSSEKIPF